MKKEIILKGKNFLLRPIRKNDALSLAKNANNKKIAKNIGKTFPSPYTQKDAQDFIKKVLKEYKNGIHTEFVIEVNGEAVGMIGGHLLPKRVFVFNFGYWLGEKYWGKGIISEAIELYTRHIFKTEKPLKIEALVFSWNDGSRKVLERNGFIQEGFFREYYKTREGKIVDEYYYGKLKNDR